MRFLQSSRVFGKYSQNWSTVCNISKVALCATTGHLASLINSMTARKLSVGEVIYKHQFLFCHLFSYLLFSFSSFFFFKTSNLKMSTISLRGHQKAIVFLGNFLIDQFFIKSCIHLNHQRFFCVAL